MIVGLTGGIGSGKTFVSSLFEKLGIAIYISDVEAKKIMHVQPRVIESIKELFGEEAYENWILNRKLIASKVFTNKKKLEQLNAIVHPAVAEHFQKWYKEQTSDFVIKESAILFETKGNEHCDAVISVIAPKDIRISRIQQRDNSTIKEIENRMKNQWDDEKRAVLSDYIINNIDKEETKNKVKEVYRLLLERFTSC